MLNSDFYWLFTHKCRWKWHFFDDFAVGPRHSNSLGGSFIWHNLFSTWSVLILFIKIYLYKLYVSFFVNTFWAKSGRLFSGKDHFGDESLSLWNIELWDTLYEPGPTKFEVPILILRDEVCSSFCPITYAGLLLQT